MMNDLSPITTIRGHSFHAGLLGRDAVVVDLGAHKGEFAREINNSFGCRCYLVEAMPALYEAIVEDAATRKYHFAMAGSDGPVTLSVSDNLEGSSIAAQAGSMGIAVQGMTLATFMLHAGLERIDLLKVDIEGAEIAMLEAADAEALSRVVQMTVEFHDFVPGLVEPHRVEEIKQKMRTLGFYVLKYSGRLNTDVLFINKRYCRLGWGEHWYLKYMLRYVRGFARKAGRSGIGRMICGESHEA